MKTVSLELHDTTYAELDLLLEEIKTHGGEWRLPLTIVEDLVRHAVATVTEGSSRPGSWERQLLHLHLVGLIP